MGSKLLNAYIIVRINALRVASAPVLTNTPHFLRILRQKSRLLVLLCAVYQNV